MEVAIAKAGALIEALPYMRSFRDKIVVVKLGGSVLASEAEQKVGLDITFMEHVGMKPVVVHGGGPAITQLMAKRQKKAEFVRGQRVTDAETIGIVLEALTEVNREMVKVIREAGGNAVGLTDREKLTLRAEKLVLDEARDVDLGYVGRITGVAMGSIVRECLSNRIPVLLPLALGPKGEIYNVNADAAAGAVAAALGAEKLVFLSDTPGVRLSDKGNDFAASLTAADAESLMQRGVISGGMIPKVEACMRALAGGVRKTHIIDGRIMHSLLLEIYTDKGIGTEIVP